MNVLRRPVAALVATVAAAQHAIRPRRAVIINRNQARLLDDATLSKQAGDGKDANQRRTAYLGAASDLSAMARLVTDAGGLDSVDASTIVGYANSAAALLLQTGLT